jgi:hypothetical protein
MVLQETHPGRPPWTPRSQRLTVKTTRALLTSDKLSVLGDRHMDVYLNTRRDLLIVKKGSPIPPIAPPGKWRKSKKRVVKVSEEIRSALQTQGYYMRKMRDLHRVNVKL